MAQRLGDIVHCCTESMMAGVVYMVVGDCGVACYISEDTESQGVREACLQTSKAGAFIFGDGFFGGQGSG